MRRRRSRASLVLLLLSILLGTATTVGLRAHLERVEARSGDHPTERVVAPTRHLERGTRVSPGDVEVVEIPAGAAPPGALRRAEMAVGLTLAADVAAGEPLTALRLARAGPVASLVPQGLRAIPVATAVPAGMVAPGDLVDVLSVVSGRPFAEVAVAGAEVLVVRDAAPGEGLGDLQTLVLLVSPDGAARIAAARASGELAIAVTPPRGVAGR